MLGIGVWLWGLVGEAGGGGPPAKAILLRNGSVLVNRGGNPIVTR